MTIIKAKPNWNFLRRQLKFVKPMYLFTKTQTKNENTNHLPQKQCMIYIYMEKTSSYYETLV